MTDVAPRPEDFGIRAEDLEGFPAPYLARHRPEAVGVLYLLVVAGVFTALVAVSGSAAAAGYLTVVLVAAASVLLLPLAVCLACAAERVETRWLCRRAPGLAACLAYRAALDEWRSRRAVSEVPRWSHLTRQVLAARLADALRRAGLEVVSTPDGWDAGYDLALGVGDRTVLVRCVAGAEAASAGIGRELAALIADGVGDEAVLAAPGGADAGLESFLVGRPIRLMGELDLEALALVASAPGAEDAHSRPRSR